MNTSISLSTDNNIEATVSNDKKLLAISMEGLSLLITNLEDFEAPSKVLNITKERKKIFIRKCIVKLSNKLLETNKEE